MGSGQSKESSSDSNSDSTSTTTVLAVAAVTSVASALLGIVLYKFIKNKGDQTATTTASSTEPRVDNDAPTVEPETTTTTTQPKLVRVDSQLDMPDSPLASSTIEPISFNASWETFSLPKVGLSFKYPKSLEPKRLGNIFMFGSQQSNLVMLVLEKEFSKEELKRIVLLSGKDTPAIIHKENPSSISKVDAVEYEFSHHNASFWAFFIPFNGRTFMVQYEINATNNQLEAVKQIVRTFSISEPQVDGLITVLTRKSNVQLKLPSIYYTLRQTDDDEDDTLVLHALDGRKKKDITTGIRIFKRKDVADLNVLSTLRMEELKEHSPKELGKLTIASNIPAIVLQYNKAIKANDYTMNETIFIKDGSGYIIQAYALVDLANNFRPTALACIASLQFHTKQTTQDLIVYENAVEKFTIQVPGDVTSINEHPLVDEILVEFIHKTSVKDTEFTTVVLKGKRLPQVSDIQSIREYTLRDIEAQSKNVRAKFGLEAFKISNEEIKQINGNEVFQLGMKTFSQHNMEPVYHFSSYLLSGPTVYTIQSQLSDSIFTKDFEKEISTIHSSFVLNIK